MTPHVRAVLAELAMLDSSALGVPLIYAPDGFENPQGEGSYRLAGPFVFDFSIEDTDSGETLFSSFWLDEEQCDRSGYALDLAPQKFCLVHGSFEAPGFLVGSLITIKPFDGKWASDRHIESIDVLLRKDGLSRGVSSRAAFTIYKGSVMDCESTYLPSGRSATPELVKHRCLSVLPLLDYAQRMFAGEREVLLYTPTERDAATNAKRMRKGKAPVLEVREVRLSGPTLRPVARGDKGGTHASPRQHERRGHWRSYKSGKKTWVEKMLVGKPDNGYVKHVYTGGNHDQVQ
jgi:hypothetical protein